MVEITDIRLDAPETNLTELSFAETSTAGINQWAAELPLANINETAGLLHLATAELALLIAQPQDKFAYLEAIRPLLHYIYARLHRATPGHQKSANESQANLLLLNLCTGYKCVALEVLNELNIEKASNKDLLASSVHRLVSDLSRILLCALQRYISPPANFWWEMNELYRISEKFELKEFTLADDENHGSTPLSIKCAYIRALLLDTCKPNQLQKAQLTAIFNAMENWTKAVNITEDPQDALLVIDLMANNGPSYQGLASSMDMPRGVQTEILAYELEAYLNDVDGQVIVPGKIKKNVIQQLCDAWSVMQERAFSRFATDTPVRVAVGLRATHYFLCGGRDFSEQIANTDELLRREINPFLDVDYEASKPEDSDPWSQAHDLKTRIPVNPNIEVPERILLQANVEPSRSYAHFESKALDSSPGGYRLEWLDEVPSNASVGELVALREEKAARWCVAVIRWLNQSGRQSSMGVELLSPRAIPVAVRAIQKLGGPTNYTRGLLLPAIEAIGQHASIVTPSVPFVVRQKINIQRQGIQSTAQLLETERKTESFNQFTFRMLDGYLENSHSDSTMDTLSAMTREDTNHGP